MQNRFLTLLSILFVGLTLVPMMSAQESNAPSISQAPISASSVAEPKPPEPLLKRFNRTLDNILFFDLAFGRLGETPDGDKIKFPLMIAVLAFGAIFFTIWFGFINIRGFRHAVNVVRGRYDDPKETGEISHFRALTSALSATVGLGNIAGVAVAIQLGGPGAVVWMMGLAVFGMTAKFSSCTLSQMYRKVNADGSISGGPMYYLEIGLRELNLKTLGKVLAIIYAVFVMFGAVAAGNMFQSNQTVEAVTDTFKIGFEATVPKSEIQKVLDAHRSDPKAPDAGAGLGFDQLEDFIHLEGNQATISLSKVTPEERTTLGAAYSDLKDLVTDNSSTLKKARFGIGILLALFVAIVVLGGIRRIGAATSRIIPLMCGIYVMAALYIIISNLGQLDDAVVLMWEKAFTDNALYGGMAGVLIMGLKRAAFSNEAGLGSAAIAHAAAKTSEPVREGMVAMLGPFIDTIIVCFMTAMVVIITGAYADEAIPKKEGVALTTAAFRSVIPWFPYVLTGCICLFAYSTMISWCYYGERGWIYLLDHFDGAGLKTVFVFRLFFVGAVLIGATQSLADVITLADLVLLSMAFPNIIGSILLAPKVKRLLHDYWDRYTRGEMKPERP